jgi:hypothetical protein
MHWQTIHRFRFLLVMLLGISCHSVAHAACQIEGPSLDETIKYLTDAGRVTVPNFSLTYNAENGVIKLESGFRQSVPVYLLDCESFVVAGHPPTNVKVWCKDNVLCVNSTQRTGEPFTEAALRIYYEADEEHALRVARALSHFVYLVQKQYDDTKDPFATKK